MDNCFLSSVVVFKLFIDQFVYERRDEWNVSDKVSEWKKESVNE